MKPLASVALGVCALGALATAQLPPGHYLIGTQGWDTTNAPDPTKNTIQTVDPYSGKATILNVTGLPAGETPATFYIYNPVHFLVGTKVAAAPAAGNVYTLLFQNGGWTANKLNTTALPINVSAMVADGGYAYIIGSGIFGTTGDDARVFRIALANGAVTLWAALGKQFTGSNPGMMGIGSGLVLVGKTLHAFSFDSTDKTPQQNEHWTVSTTTQGTFQQLPSLPLSKRWIGRGHATNGALFDPVTGLIVVCGRVGELVWRDTNGKDIHYESFPNPFTFPNTEVWRGYALNLDTYAIGLGDHQDAGIDERRCRGTAASEPFANDIAKAVRPSDGVFTIAGMTYIGSTGDYRPIGDGCTAGADGVPCSYSLGAPSQGNQNFGFSLHLRPAGATTPTIGVLMISASKIKYDLTSWGAPNCIIYVDPVQSLLFGGVSTSGSDIKLPVAVPGNFKGTVYTQWYRIEPKANALGVALSDARELVIR